MEGPVISIRKLTIIVGLSILASSSALSETQVKELVRVSSCDEAPLLVPPTWAPDGSGLAFVSDGALQVWDTSGVIKSISISNMPIHAFLWANNSDIVLDYWSRTAPGRATGRLSVINLRTESEQILAEYDHTAGVRSDEEYFTPQRSIQGNVIFEKRIGTDKSAHEVAGSSHTNSKATISPDGQEIVRWGNDGLYRVNLMKYDSIRVAPKPYEHIITPVRLHNDQSYYITGGTIYSFDDSNYIVLDTIISDYFSGEDIWCGFTFQSTFHPIRHAVICDLSCADSLEVESERVLIYDMVRMEFMVLDKILGMKGCHASAFSPDGAKVSFICEGSLFVGEISWDEEGH